MTTVTTIKALGTNFTYVHRYGERDAFVLDPGSVSGVLETVEQHDLVLTAILVTHHHWDHVAGAEDLRRKMHCELIGVDSTLLPRPDRIVAEGDVLTFGDVSVQVVATPGHTRNSVCYYVLGPSGTSGVAYTGDTLFVGGCGRLLECDAATMWRSLQKLVALPDDTLVYCGHDYALENYEFAVSMDPTNRRFQQRLSEVQKTAEYGRLTVPSTVAQERATNIFLLADDPRLRAVLGMPDAAPADVFSELRSRKDAFG